MSLELLSTLATVGTFIVIAVTALAAVVQLRHLRASNQLHGLLTVLARVEDANFNQWVDDARKAVTEKLPDPTYREQVIDGTFERANNPWLNLANSYEWVGSLVRNRLIEEGPFMDVYAYRVSQAWEILTEIIALRRTELGPSVWENFEYIALRARQWIAKYGQHGRYPAGMPRLNPTSRWLAGAPTAT